MALVHVKKVRIRWYGNLNNAEKAKLEFKQRQAGKGYKVIYDTKIDFNLPQFAWQHALKSAYSNFPLDAQCLWATEHSPIIIYRYHREYYISSDK